jgi:hypothetical protein
VQTTQFTQHAAKEKLDEKLYTDIFEGTDERGKALLNSKSQKYANAWLLAVPAAFCGQKIAKAEFRAALKYHSMIPLYEREPTCPFCNKRADIFGDHFISCSTTGQRIEKHNTLVRFVAEKLRGARVPIVLSLGVDKDVMGDLVLRNWRNGRDLYLDFSVAGVLTQSYRTKGALEKLGAAKARCEEKKKKYEQQMQIVDFQPIVFESLGAIEHSAIPILKLIASRISEFSFIESKEALKRLVTGLSIQLQKHNGAMLASRLHA